jgi:hypothetical protein
MRRRLSVYERFRSIFAAAQHARYRRWSLKMKLNLLADPSALPEIAELSLSLVLLLTMGLFLGSFAVRQADQAIAHALTHQARTVA